MDGRMFDSRLPQELVAVLDSPELACTLCGCTDSQACEGGCFWITKAPAICSRCYTVAELLEAIR